MRSKRKLLLTAAFTALLGVSAFAGVSLTKEAVKPAEVEADYSSTIRVYVDLDWSNINYVRLGTKEESGNAVLSSSNAKYNQSLGKYVKDISSGSTYDKMGCYFSQSGQWWQYQYEDGYIWISGGFKPGYEYQIKSIGYVSESGGIKYFAATPLEIGEITDNVVNPTVYFVDGNSWHLSGTVYVHYWGGTASSTYPGSSMTDSGLRLKAYVGETEYSGLHIYQYTISGSAAYVQFNNNSSKTGDLRAVNGKVYFFGVSAETYEVVANFLVSLKGQLGSYTYNGRSFASSICHLSQSEASTFVSTYNNLDTNYGSGVASSVKGSGIITYDTPETSNTHTGEVSLTDIKNSLIKKYPTISPFGRITLINSVTSGAGATIAIVATSASVLAAVGGYFLFRKKKEN